MIFSESLDYYLSKNFKNSEAYSLLNGQLDKYPYDYLRYVKFTDKSYSDFIQGASIDYRVNPERPRDITVIMKVDDCIKKRKIVLEIRHSGNEVNIITRTPKEDTKVFHVNYFRDDAINVLCKTIKFYNSDKEELVDYSFARLDNIGNMLDFKSSKDDMIKNNKSNKKYGYQKKRQV